MARNTKPLAHGSRGRYRIGCRCVACGRSNYRREDRPTDLRWPLRFLTDRHDPELVMDTIHQVLKDPQDLKFYRENGLGDFDADEVATRLGDHPMMIWPGWIEAGLDNE